MFRFFAIITFDVQKKIGQHQGGIPMIRHQRDGAPLVAALLCGMLFFCSTSAVAKASPGTTVTVTNDTPNPVPVMVTLGIGHFGITNINQLPWHIRPEPANSTTQGIFLLPGKSSVSFNSGSKSFSGNIAFGPTFTARGQGNSGPNACYPNATNLAEFTLNQPGETVDISRVNGSNAKIAINFKNGSPWNDGAGKNKNVSEVADVAPISTWLPSPGVYGWQATNCVNVVPPVPNGPPSNLAPAPVNAPSKPQLQAKAQCNIQRPGNVQSGGTVQIVFKGWDADALPRCMDN
jgi:hypothetical protein